MIEGSSSREKNNSLLAKVPRQGITNGIVLVLASANASMSPDMIDSPRTVVVGLRIYFVATPSSKALKDGRTHQVHESLSRGHLRKTPLPAVVKYSQLIRLKSVLIVR